MFMENEKKDKNENLPILDSYFKQIEKLYEDNPSFTINELNNLIDKTKRNKKYVDKSLLDKLFTNKEKELALSIFLMILMVPFCLFTLNNLEFLLLYLFGLVFFLAGLNTGFSLEKIGIIVLFSHGATGMGLMLYSVLAKSFESGLFTDGGRNLIIYLTINISIIVIGFLAVVIYNVSDYIRNIKYMKSYILLIFIAGLTMAGIFPYIMKFIYSL